MAGQHSVVRLTIPTGTIMVKMLTGKTISLPVNLKN